MENKRPSHSSVRNFGHSVVTWEIENYGLALWQNYWEVDTPCFSILGQESQKTKWKLILQTDSNGQNISERMSVKFDRENRRAIVFDSKQEENIRGNSKETESTNIDFDEIESVEEGNQKLPVDTDTEQTEIKKTEVKRNYICDSLMLSLERSKVDKGPNTVWVNWKVYYVGVDGKKFSVAEEEHFFVKGCRYGVHIGIIFDLEREFQYNSGVVTLVCDMIVRDKHTNVSFDKNISIDLLGLSEDFQWIFEQQKFSDVEIKLDKKSIFAHKAMLSLGSDHFKNVFKETNLDVVELFDLSYDAVVKTLDYIYSGDLAVIEKPSISIYDSIGLLNLTDLEAHYVPDTQKIRTNIVVKRLTYTWSIKDFTTKETSCLSSPIICKDIEDAAWQIHLYPRGAGGNSEFVSVSVEYLEGTVSDDLCIQCAVLEENETYQSWRTLRKSAKLDSRFEDEEFIDRKKLSMLKDDLLKLGFKVRMYTGKEHSPIGIKAGTPVLCTKKTSLEKLSNSMSSLLQTKEYSDIVLKVGDEEIKAHKFILSARSFTLSSMLEETKESCLILSVKPNILKILLEYMYAAILDVSDVTTLLEVYDAAEEFLVSRLQEKCSKILRKSLTLDTVCNVLDLADDYGNQLVKKEAIKFVYTNDSVFEQQAWQDLKSRKPQLCEGVETIKRLFSSENAALFTRSDERKKDVIFKEIDNQISDVLEKSSDLLVKAASIADPIDLQKEISEVTEINGTEVSELHEAAVDIIASNQEPKSDKTDTIVRMMVSENVVTRSSQCERNEAFRKEIHAKVEVVPEKISDLAESHSVSDEKCGELSIQPTVEMVRVISEQSGVLETDLMTNTNENIAHEQHTKNGIQAVTQISKESQEVLQTENEEDRRNGLEIGQLIPEERKEIQTQVDSETCKVIVASETTLEPRGNGLTAEVLKDPCAVKLTSEVKESDSCAKGLETTPKTER